jgi:uncharacterized protein YciI
MIKYFLIEGEHLAPFDEFRHLEPAHHAFLQKGYDDGFFLFSGPQIPAHGGFLLARSASREALDTLLAEEPFIKAGKMRFSRIVEFHPAQFQSVLKDWFVSAGN